MLNRLQDYAENMVPIIWPQDDPLYTPADYNGVWGPWTPTPITAKKDKEYTGRKLTYGEKKLKKQAYKLKKEKQELKQETRKLYRKVKKLNNKSKGQHQFQELLIQLNSILNSVDFKTTLDLVDLNSILQLNELMKTVLDMSLV